MSAFERPAALGVLLHTLAPLAAEAKARILELLRGHCVEAGPLVVAGIPLSNSR